LKLILLNLLPAVILGSLPPILSFILTQKIREIKEAIGEFKYHMKEMVEIEGTRIGKLCFGEG